MNVFFDDIPFQLQKTKWHFDRIGVIDLIARRYIEDISVHSLNSENIFITCRHEYLPWGVLIQTIKQKINLRIDDLMLIFNRVLNAIPESTAYDKLHRYYVLRTKIADYVEDIFFFAVKEKVFSCKKYYT